MGTLAQCPFQRLRSKARAASSVHEASCPQFDCATRQNGRTSQTRVIRTQVCASCAGIRMLYRIPELSLRLYLQVSELKLAGMDWTQSSRSRRRTSGRRSSSDLRPAGTFSSSSTIVWRTSFWTCRVPSAYVVTSLTRLDACRSADQSLWSMRPDCRN